MIEKLLEAYEAKVTEDKTLQKKLKDLDRITKVFVWISLISGLVIFSIFIFKPSEIMLLIIAIYIFLLQILNLYSERVRHKKWEKNLTEYTYDIELIRGLLKEDRFGLYEKNKIKQLIRKYNQSIVQHERNKEQNGRKIQDFCCTYLFPIIAFFAGKISDSNITNDEWFLWGIVVVFIVISIKYACSSIIQFVELVGWNRLEKEKNFVLKLQDLLDTDFIIKEKDLIE